MRALCPWLVESDGPACRAWAEMEILATVIYGRLRDEGLATPDGEPVRESAETRRSNAEPSAPPRGSCESSARAASRARAKDQPDSDFCGPSQVRTNRSA